MQYIFKWKAGALGGRTRIAASNLTEACEKIREYIENRTASTDSRTDMHRRVTVDGVFSLKDMSSGILEP